MERQNFLKSMVPVSKSVISCRLNSKGRRLLDHLSEVQIVGAMASESRVYSSAIDKFVASVTSEIAIHNKPPRTGRKVTMATARRCRALYCKGALKS